jgi:MinD-like ATPase involved in chromosome partitioning or flagellar assembly
MKSIVICSGKGSPGATFVSVNLTFSLSGLGRPAVLLDLDPYGGDVAGYLGLDPRKGLYPLGLLSRSDYSTEDLIAEIEERGGVFSIAGFPKSTVAHPGLFSQILTSAIAGDRLVIADLGRIDEPTADVARDADLVVVVARPDLISTHAAQRAKDILLGSGVLEGRIRLLVNGWEWRRAAEVAEIADAVGLPSIGMIPLARAAARKALQAQLPIPKGRAAKAFHALAVRITESDVEVHGEMEVAVA